jgi:hypothetical protein
MDTKVKFLKQLALKVTSATSEDEVAGETVCEVLDYIVKNYKESAGTQGPQEDPGTPGKDGKSVTAIELTTDESGKVTGGTVTFSDETTSPITVNQAGV